MTTLLPVNDDLIADYVCYCEGAKESGYEDPMPFSVWRQIETQVRADFEDEPEIVGFIEAAKICPVFRTLTGGN